MKARVLVVEDNATNLALMEYLLRVFGYDVLTASDGLEGIEVARRERPDLILLDVQMPKMNGFEAAARLRADPDLRYIILVAVTAFAMVGDREQILSRGFDGYIAKPILPESFANQLLEFLHTDASARPTAPSLVSPTAQGAVRPRPHRTILVVDNSATQLVLAASILEPSGYDVIQALGAHDALRAIESRRPTLILCDLHMPHQSGFDLFDRLQEHPWLRTIPFVLFTNATVRPADEQSARQRGILRILNRPVEPDALVEAIENCMADALRPGP